MHMQVQEVGEMSNDNQPTSCLPLLFLTFGGRGDDESRSERRRGIQSSSPHHKGQEDRRKGINKVRQSRK